MEQSAFEAVMIGVNVFVFIIALTAGILLMTNVINMVNYANENAIVGMNGSLAESVGVVNDRLYTGSQMLTYYRKAIEIEELQKVELDYVFNVKLTELGNEISLKDFIEDNEQTIINYLNEKFELQYKEQIGGKHVYVFSLYQEDGGV